MTNSTVPRSWKGWRDVGSDVNWEDYGGKWMKQAPDGTYFFLIFTNMEDACGRDALEGPDPMRYLCEVRQVALREMDSKQISDCMSYVGMDEDDLSHMTEEETEVAIACAAVDYGVYAPLHSESALTYPERVRAAARRVAEELIADDAALEDRLAQPVNRIGSTAADFRKGDVMAGLGRYCAEVDRTGRAPDATKNLMLKLHGVLVSEESDGR
jgi:hypothetical protein